MGSDGGMGISVWALLLAAALAGCGTRVSPPAAAAGPSGAAGSSGAVPAPDSVRIERTAHGVAHITAADLRWLAYGVAFAHAQDNFCQTAQHLVTVRGERSRHFGPKALGLLGLRALPNEVIDLFIGAHMDDAALATAWNAASPEARLLAQGYVEGYNRHLADHAGRLPAACNAQPWVRPMTVAEYRRIQEVLVAQAGIVALADGVVGAQPPSSPAAAAGGPSSVTAVVPAAALVPATALVPANDGPDVRETTAALREIGLVDPPWGSNAWAFGRDTTANGRGLLLGNPHFPWVGVNRFWQVHLTVPGLLDVMGASIGHTPLVQIGFNRDVAWSHTVSTGKRFTLHELKLVPGDPTSYLVDGQPRKMIAKGVGGRTLWRSEHGPIVVNPRAGLNWTTEVAYAIQDANRGNARSLDTWLAINRAMRVQDVQAAQRNLGIPWVNTIAADRLGQALYADNSVVPDLPDALLQRCLAGPRARALLAGPGLVVLDGSRAECRWQRSPESAVAGLMPASRMPEAVRLDWVQNSNDSFFHTHPDQRFENIAQMVGDAAVRRARTRASLIEIPALIAQGRVTAERLQAQIFSNRNHAAEWVLPDLLAACAQAPSAAAREGCSALAGFGRVNDLDARGAHLFCEFWRTASAAPGVWRVPFDAAQPIRTPMGLKMADPAVAAAVWSALEGAVDKVRKAGFALDAPLGQVQRPVTAGSGIGLHGGDEIEGVLNNLGDRGSPGIGPKGLAIDYGTSYIQVVGFDERGPVAHALLTYGQSTDPASPHAQDQTRLYAARQWPRLPFHADEVAQARVGEPLVLRRSPPSAGR